MKNNTCAQNKKSPMRRLSTLLVLVLFIFTVLLFSYTLAGTLLYILVANGVLSPFGERNFVGTLLFLLFVSLAIGTIFSAIAGTLFLRPLRRLIIATKEVAAGNFNIRVEASGPHEMQRLTNSFNEMAGELGRIETLQNDFVSNVSHEFKTPVASIQGFARLLKRDSLTSEQRNEYLDVILLESERMAQLSNNVLLLSNLDSTAQLLEKTEFSLDEQLRQSVLLVQPPLERKQLNIEIECERVQVVANEELLKQVWLNLLGNAIKFTPEGGTIRIRATAAENVATVVVEDTGIGMDEEMQKHLFDKFYQGDSSRATQGNGLGLALVKRILVLSGGSISVRSNPGQGARFTVTLPQKRS